MSILLILDEVRVTKSEVVEECSVLEDLCNLYSRILKERVYIIDEAIGSLPLISGIWRL